MPVYDFSSGLGLLGSGIDSLGASLKDSYKTQSSQALATALANGDYAGAMQAAAAAGDTASVLKLQDIQRQAAEGATFSDLAKKYLANGFGSAAGTPAPGGAPAAAGGGALSGSYDATSTEAYIRQAAQARGIDPDIAVRVARSEGLGSASKGQFAQGDRDAAGNYTSFGPFQLHYAGQGGGMGSGGLGTEFTRRTGLDARDPATVKQQIDFALDEAKRGGWGPWHGAQKVGIGQWAGIGTTTARSEAAAPVAAPVAANTPPPDAAAPVVAGADPVWRSTTGETFAGPNGQRDAGPGGVLVSPGATPIINPQAGAVPAALPPATPATPATATNALGGQSPLVNAPLPPVRPPGLGGTLTPAANLNDAVAHYIASHIGPATTERIMAADPATPMSQLAEPGSLQADDMAKPAGQFIAEARTHMLQQGMTPGAPGPGAGTMSPVVSSGGGTPRPDIIPTPVRAPPAPSAPPVPHPADLPPQPGYGDEKALHVPVTIPPAASYDETPPPPPPAPKPAAPYGPPTLAGSLTSQAFAPSATPRPQDAMPVGDVSGAVNRVIGNTLGGAVAGLQGLPDRGAGATVSAPIGDIASRLAPAAAPDATAAPAAPPQAGAVPAALPPATPATPAAAGPAIEVEGYEGKYTRGQADDSEGNPSQAEWDAAAKEQGVSVPAAAPAAAPPAPVAAKLPPTPAAVQAGDPTVTAAGQQSPQVARSLANTRPGSDQRMILLALMARAAAGSANPQGNLKFVEGLAAIEKAHQEQFEKQKTPVTPDELAQLGIKPAPGVGYQKDAFGNITTVQGAKPQVQILTNAEAVKEKLPAAPEGSVWTKDADGTPKIVSVPDKTEKAFRPPTDQEKITYPGVVYMDDNSKKPFFPPAPLVRLEPGESDLAKIKNEPIKEAITSGQAATAQRRTLAVMKDAFEYARTHGGELPSGKLGPTVAAMRSYASSLGLGDFIDLTNVSQADVVEKLNAVLAAASAKSINQRGGTQFEFKTFLGNNPGLSQTPEGRMKLIEILDQDAARTEAIRRIAMRRDTNPDNFEARVEEYDQANPLLSPWTGKPLTTGERVPGFGTPAAPAPKAAPGAAPKAAPQAAAPKIGEGTIVYSTDGSGKRQIYKDGKWQPL